ncbi:MULTISPECIES: hypothetical protein [Natrialbaceae]|uniref:hypothetical protein n=1 Tax=Natrialbaceae TaxID=1644061 RepID=UPI00207C8B9C|nr:hypothetical protein [Natronococcus sp. CG52]
MLEESGEAGRGIDLDATKVCGSHGRVDGSAFGYYGLAVRPHPSSSVRIRSTRRTSLR